MCSLDPLPTVPLPGSTKQTTRKVSSKAFSLRVRDGKTLLAMAFSPRYAANFGNASNFTVYHNRRGNDNISLRLTRQRRLMDQLIKKNIGSWTEMGDLELLDDNVLARDCGTSLSLGSALSMYLGLR